MEETVELTLDDFALFKNKDPIKHRLSYYGYIEEYTIDGQFIRTWKSVAEIAEKYNIVSGSIGNCILGKILYIQKINRIFLREGESIDERLDAIDKLGLKKSKPLHVAVDEYTLQGKYVRSYNSYTEINYNTPSVRRVCKGDLLYSRTGRIFLFSGTGIKNRLELIEQDKYNKAAHKSINEYDKTGLCLKRWKSASDIAYKTGISDKTIIDCCFGYKNSIRGRIYLFSGDSITKRLKTIRSKKKIKK